ncbi:MAG: LuxR C-terminal-related transcriptional regulator [Acidobacteriota bacterium]
MAVLPALWAELLGQALGREPGLRVLGSAATEDELKALACQSGRVVVILDYEAFGPNTEGLVARLRRAAPAARTLVLARRPDADAVASVLRAGAAGLVAKNARLATLLDAIRAAAAGQVWANRETTAQVIGQLVTPVQARADGATALTRREWEVVDAIATGLTNRAAARRLGISEKTVKTHLNNIFAKTRLHSRFALALWAQGQAQPKA